MKKTSIIQTKSVALAAAIAFLGLGAIQAQAQSVNFTFSDDTSDGWFNSGFGSSPAASVVTIGAQNYIDLPYVGFQSGNVSSSSSTLSTFGAAMNAALNNPSGYDFSYTWYVNTAEAGWATGNAGGPATYLQLGVFVNTGSSYYEQDYGGNDSSEPQLNGTQMASGSVFTGTVTLPFTVFSPADAAAGSETFWRLGLVENSNGSGDVEFTDISITPVPEPASLALAGLGGLSMLFLRRRKA